VALDGLDAEEQLGGDLRVGLAVDDETGDLELALGKRIDAIALARAGLSMIRRPSFLVGALFAALYLPARARTEPDPAEPEVPEAVAA
jgi:hypothetical protein